MRFSPLTPSSNGGFMSRGGIDAAQQRSSGRLLKIRCFSGRWICNNVLEQSFFFFGLSSPEFSAPSFFWTEATIRTPYLRIAAGICVVAAGLLFGGGGAIAGADTDLGDSSSGEQGVGGTSQGASTSTGPATAADGNSKTSMIGEDAGSAVAEARGSGGSAATTTTLTATGEESDIGAAGGGESDGAEFETTVADAGAAAPDSIATTPAGTVPAEISASSDSSEVSTDSRTVAPQRFRRPAVPTDPMTSALRRVSDALDTRAGVNYSIPEPVPALPSSPTPITDAIASMQTMVTAVIGVIGPLAQLPGNLHAMLGVPPSTMPPPLIGAGPAPVGPAAPTHPAPDAPLFGPVTSRAPVLTTSSEEAPLFGAMAPRQRPIVTPASAHASGSLAVSGTVPLTVGTTTPAQSFFEHVIKAVLVPASLTALAAIALPGIGGLLVVAATGIRLGYRQAKAALRLRNSTIARFTRPGPIGVVRTGSLVLLRQRARGPRTARAVCPEAARRARKLEPVA